MILPVIAVTAVKRSEWGSILTAPANRQTGDPHAKLLIVEYSDFQCPSCAVVNPATHRLLEIYRGKVHLVYKYYPLTKIHRNALPAAVAAQCAANQNRFWPYADRLFATQASWAPLTDPATSFIAIANELALDLPHFNTCRADPLQKEVVLRDADEARKRQIHSTPTFLIGDERLVGKSIESDGARAIEKALWR
ncbi:MAG: thioredoxin domain-containing protein [Elusimicrobiota bacterium]